MSLEQEITVCPPTTLSKILAGEPFDAMEGYAANSKW
jgi:hypothetical protein